MNARQRGFGVIAAIVILVILAGISAALVRMGTTQQLTSTQDILSARALQTARAGNEWGLYQALSAGTCGGPTTLDLRAETGFAVTVTCSAKSFNEGESSPGVARVVTTYSIEAVACNAGSCPDAALAATPGYVERKRLVTANTP
jgi:MSHA biogenesis protein MshP